MKPIHRRTLVTALGTSLLPSLVGCGGGKGNSGYEPSGIDPPQRGVGSIAWRTSLSLVPQKKFVLRTRHESSDNTLRVITQETTITGPLTEYTLDYTTGRVLRENAYAYDSPEAATIKGFLEPAGRMRGLFRQDTPSSLTRLATNTLQPLWTFTVEERYAASEPPVIRNPIVAPDGTVYMVVDETFLGYRPKVHALDGATGQLKWKGDWFLGPSVAAGTPGLSWVSLEASLSTEGIVVIDTTWIMYPGQFDADDAMALTILNPATGKVVRGVPLFGSRGLWNITIPNPLLTPEGKLIALLRDSVVALRTK